MKPGIPWILLLPVLGGIVFSSRAADTESPARLQQVFVAAAQAYDQGQTDKAAEMYDHLLEKGYVSSELLYNLGNACFRSGRLGPAVLAYRRAWHLSPRDPDLLANLNFALQAAGATPPDPPAWIQVVRQVSLQTWAMVAVIAFWAGCVALGVSLWFARARTVLQRGVLACGMVLLVSLAGSAAWLDLLRKPEVVILRPDQKALAGPLSGATVLFAIPEGAIARTMESSGPWIRIGYDRQNGWIPAEACKTVYSLTNLRRSYQPPD